MRRGSTICWYDSVHLQSLKHVLDVEENKAMEEYAAKKIDKTLGPIASHRWSEKIPERGRTCLEKISANPGMLLLKRSAMG